ncbi:Lebocin-1/2 [Papilio machaon]|uniref:Lebocin-1/2 n=1 Tax=Papilio machaon TaxID=76193 RepID=A0A194QKS8_PAPMA|nr:Lebocin-1/2 [Papilio machaon]
MAKLLPIFAILAAFVSESLCGDRLIRPTYRPPPQRPVIRMARQVNDEPLWLYRGDDVIKAPSTGEHPYLPSYIDDIKLDPNIRVARSFDSRSSKHSSGSHSTSNGSRDTGATHPGYNRRNARSIQTPPLFPTLSPTRPRYPPFPIYVRSPRDVQFQGFKKPTYHDVVIPNWNPNVKTDPRQILRIKSRN